MKKTIPISQLKPGMFMVGMDQSWWKTPFLRHHRFIKDAAEIQLLRQSGVKEVTIDTSRSPTETDCSDEDREQASTILEEHSPVPSQMPDEMDRLPDQECLDSREPAERELEEGNASALRTEEGHCTVNGSRPAASELPSPHGDAGGEETPQSSSSQAIEAAKKIHETTVLVVEQMFEGVATGVPIENVQLAQAVDGILANLFKDHRTLPHVVLVQNLQAIDKTLYTHVVDVCVLASMVGIEMQMESDALTCLAMGALLHDVGYLRLPRNVVRRRGERRGQMEQALLQKHAELGKLILGHGHGVSDDVQRIVSEHHERQDGSGFPQELSGNAIHQLSQVVGVVDAFDNLVSSWGRWPVVPPGMALRDIYKEAQSGCFLLETVNHLIRCLGVYPLGSAVVLSTGERGIVSRVNADHSLKPEIILIADSKSRPYPVPIQVDLANPDTDGPERTIQGLLDSSKEQIPVGQFLQAAGW